ncbi:IS66 family insertion sequence element accessory protein TnpB [Salmonella enterica]|nr:IS66 family insertion sequence element accessory protein TnpB [Salmonella enterica]
MVELASSPRACVAQIARENSVNDNVIFKWLRLWQNEGCISRRLPTTVVTSSLPTILPVEVVPDPTQSGGMKTEPAQFSALNASSTLENPSPELLAVPFRELTGRLPEKSERAERCRGFNA